LAQSLAHFVGIETIKFSIVVLASPSVYNRCIIFLDIFIRQFVVDWFIDLHSNEKDASLAEWEAKDSSLKF